MRKFFLALILVGFFNTITAIAPAKISALSGGEFQAGRIIDDSVFFNGGAMAPNSIQTFLNAKVPNCDTNGTQPYGGTTRAAYGASRGYPAPYTCLRNYSQDTPTKGAEPGLCNQYNGGVKSAAQIIYDVGQACGISQKTLLILLEKEQSLVTDDWPWGIQYRSATGYGCPDTAPCDAEYYGFFNQVYNAARQFKRYSRDANLFSYRAYRNNYIQYNPNAGCGGANVYIQNQATAGLYNYTPYQPNASALNNLYGSGDGCGAYGNRNFWRLFNDWFGSTQSSYLQKGSGTTVYLVVEGVRFAIPSAELIRAYGLQNNFVTPVSDAYLAGLQDGGILTTLITTPGNPTTYLVDGGKKYGIPSNTYCSNWGLPCGDLVLQKSIAAQIMNTIPDGGVLMPLMNSGGTVFRLNAGSKEAFLSPQALFERGYGWGNITPIENSVNYSQPFGVSLPQNYSLIKFSSSPAFYLFTDGNFYSIPSFDTYRSWFNPSYPIYGDSFSSYNTTPPAVAGTIPKVVLSDNIPYLIDGNRRLNISNLGLPLGQIPSVGVLKPLYDQLQPSQIINSTKLWAPTGAIYTLDNGRKRAVYSMNDFFASGYSISQVIGLDNESIQIFENGDTLFGQGTLIKAPSGPAIYAVGLNNKLYSLNKYTDLFNFGFDTSRVVSVSDSYISTAFVSISPLTNIAVNENGVKYLLNDSGEKILLTTDDLNQWGLQSYPAINLGNHVLSRVISKSTKPTFSWARNGTIYKGENGKKRPISSWSQYIYLGGNATNTYAMPDNVLQNIETGATY